MSWGFSNRDSSYGCVKWALGVWKGLQIVPHVNTLADSKVVGGGRQPARLSALTEKWTVGL